MQEKKKKKRTIQNWVNKNWNSCFKNILKKPIAEKAISRPISRLYSSSKKSLSRLDGSCTDSNIDWPSPEAVKRSCYDAQQTQIMISSKTVIIKTTFLLFPTSTPKRWQKAPTKRDRFLNLKNEFLWKAFKKKIPSSNVFCTDDGPFHSLYIQHMKKI